MAQKSTLRDRFATYNFAECEQNAVIESNWRLIKDEPLSTKHAENDFDEQTQVVTLETDSQLSNFAPHPTGRRYELDGVAFVCRYKLTPVSTDADGKPTGFKTYYCGDMIRGGQTSEAFCLTSTDIKNRLLGRQAWASQKGPRAGAIPTTRAEAKTYAEQWSAELLGHLDKVQEILETYTGGTTMPDLSAARQICKVRAYRHSLTLLAEYKAQEAEQKAERQAKTTAQKASKLGDVSAADMLAILAAKGITLEQLMAAQK
jgi:hypothetical protein